MKALTLGASGVDVGHIQQALIEGGYSIAPTELVTESFGPSTFATVKTFQTSRQLQADGIVGPKTLDALKLGDHNYVAGGWVADLVNCRAELKGVLTAASAQIGEHEVPDGSNVVASNRYGNDGQAWCAYFISWAYGSFLGGSPFGVIASAYKMLEWGKAQGRVLLPGDKPQPGDVFIILRGNTFHGHVGLVSALLADGRVCSIEGNAGNAVRGTVRNHTGFTAIVRPVV